MDRSPGSPWIDSGALGRPAKRKPKDPTLGLRVSRTRWRIHQAAGDLQQTLQLLVTQDINQLALAEIQAAGDPIGHRTARLGHRLSGYPGEYCHPEPGATGFADSDSSRNQDVTGGENPDWASWAIFRYDRQIE